MTFIKCVHALLLAMLLPAAVSLTAFPALGKTGDENQLKINISGTVVATGRCVFRNHSSPHIDFGDVRFSSVAGVNNIEGRYIRELDASMSCIGDTAGTTRFSMNTINGSAVSDGSYESLPVIVGGIQTVNKNLAIRLFVNGKQQSINKDFIVDIHNLPTLEAELVQLNPDDNTWQNGQSIESHGVLVMSFD
ncbi:hypothetical protein [Morganella morganii]|uniref:hypothetical protein n=1 Tax=Morganella morganii TaxID=582 RepID=UPI001BD922CB|nr:hypothetical protein [Morganella morganii]ELT0453263.1 type 1 fimbrial protein [Morganella morganii]MBT0336268.1 type 1 fimbrial protein [Morganella morganii subsp. morganii]